MPSYTLNYFNARGRAELTRLVFAAAGVEFTDNRVEFANWPALKAEAPLGQMPYLEVDGVKLPQSCTIARFVAHENNLAGKTNLEMAQADAVVDTLLDLVNFYYANVFKVQDEEEKKKAGAAFLENQAAAGAKNLEKLIGLYGKNGFSVGDSLTWADLMIFDVCSSMFEKVPTFMESFPVLTAVHKSVAANEKVAAYVASRPATPF